eukprot:m.85551 g.85551  ORF g.85551 m.85551 type:complete len:417 (-) comp19786_c0_seq1:243-1493(-)
MSEAAATTAKFLPHSALVKQGGLPRCGSDVDFVHPITGELNANLCRPRGDFAEDSTVFIFVSHRWLQPARGPSGHPDDPAGSKYTLLLAAIASLATASITPSGLDVAVWIDFCCIDQDAAPASELASLGDLIAGCDCILTVVVDEGHAVWEYPIRWRSYFTEYLAPGWVDYWDRAWCRVEALLAATRPATHCIERARLFRGALASTVKLGRRPHMLYGSKEMANSKTPLFLPPLLHKHLDEFSPDKGSLTVYSDRPIIERLAEEARQASVASQLRPGWRQHPEAADAEAMFTGEGEGRGVRVYADGDVYTGDFLDEKRHGLGKYVETTGNCYVGRYVLDQMETAAGETAVCTYANGNVYEGEFQQSERHGNGRYTLADGDCYEGSWAHNRKHGHGVYTAASTGVVQVGEWHENTLL